ncbi:MAG TPA: hypothetical protein VFM54_23315 [Micromonosporaceae bacterium]|nr:hypothetical protein [Micromonosporaceae bacterium]
MEIKHARQLDDVTRRLKRAKGTIRRDTAAGLKASGTDVLREVQSNVEALEIRGFRVRGRGRKRFRAKLPGTKIRRRISRVTQMRVSTARTMPRLDLYVDSDKLGSARNLPGYFDRRTKFRHPLPGTRRVWAAQQSRSGWFREPVLRKLPAVRQAVDAQLDRTRRALDGRGR